MPYVPHTAEDIRSMLERIGLRSLEDLFRSVPAELRLRADLSLPAARSEAEILREFERLAARNRRIDDRPSFLGAGIYHRFIPAAVDYLSSRGEFNTAYTPYQPEASQGTLQAIFEYQSLITRLTGMEIANASLYEGATALAEAILMAYAAHGKGDRVLVSGGVHPDHLRVLETYFQHHPIGMEILPLGPGGVLDPAMVRERAAPGSGVFAVAIQSPNFFGLIEDGRALRAAADGGQPAGEGKGPEPAPRPLLVVSADPISLALLEPPGAYGADVAVGDGQGLGNDPSFGGPSFGFFATRKEHVRKVPGRIVGETTDHHGRRGYVLTFQTREQHIRRERATSNICTNQGLCSLRGAMYLAFLGEQGLRLAAEQSTRLAHLARARIGAIPGVRAAYGPAEPAPFFQEFVVAFPLPAAEIDRALAQRGIVGGLPLERYFPERRNEMLIACTEMTTAAHIDLLAEALREILARPPEGRDAAKGNGRIASLPAEPGGAAAAGGKGRASHSPTTLRQV